MLQMQEVSFETMQISIKERIIVLQPEFLV